MPDLPPVQPYTTTLQPGNAYWMARLAQAVYQKVSASNPAPAEARILQSLQADDPKFVAVTGC